MSAHPTSPEALPVDVPATGLPPKPAKLEPGDIMQLENHFLKIQNLKMQGEKLVADAKQCQQMILDEQLKLKAFRDSLSPKYGLDISKCHIETDGTLKPGAVRSLPGIPGV